MAEFSENRHISNLINMSCKVIVQFHNCQFKIETSINRSFNLNEPSSLKKTNLKSPDIRTFSQ